MRVPIAHGVCLCGKTPPFQWQGLSLVGAPQDVPAPLYPDGLNIHTMTSRPKLIHQALAFYRNYGTRATLLRIRDELVLRFRQRGDPELYGHAFDPNRFVEHLQNPELCLVVFDIFDTLITRPLLDPESTKRWVAIQLAQPDYPTRRHAAEAGLRARSERDVGLAEICAEYIRLFGDQDGDAATLQGTEESVELLLAAPRAAYANLPSRARQAGKRVVLASDMFLSERHLRRMLQQCGITDFDALYVSSEVGVRKSSGGMYHHILQQERVSPNQALMVGDHPVSDQQIPSGLGMNVMGLESLRALAEQSPRFAPWQAQALAAEDAATELWIGLIAQRFFGSAGYGLSLDRAALTQGGRVNIGYAITGPLLVAFSEWLHDQLLADKVDRVYFLSREGQMMQAVYEVLYGDQEVASTHYLVVSRRAITVPMLQTREDIHEIARATYLPNSLEEFIYRRYGLRLDAARLAELDSLWPQGRKVAVSGGRIDHLIPVLDRLAPEILAIARQEEAAMRSYLEESGLKASGTTAVVDVGYSGSIQARLCEMLQRPVNGYYMVTRLAAQQIRDRFGVTIRGCFGQEQEGQTSPPTLRYNVPLEMLMGSDDPQIRCYRREGEKITGEFHELSDDEIQSNPMRQELREGALAFVKDYRALRDAGLGPLRIDPKLAEALFADFWEGAAESERQAIYNIATDDHYCGMGIVHFSTFLPR